MNTNSKPKAKQTGLRQRQAAGINDHTTSEIETMKAEFKANKEKERAAKLEQRFSAVQAKVAQKSSEFEQGMQAAGQLLAQLFAKDHYGMNQLPEPSHQVQRKNKVLGVLPIVDLSILFANCN